MNDLAKELGDELGRVCGPGAVPTLVAYAHKLVTEEQDLEAVLAHMIDEVKAQGAGTVVALASRAPALIDTEIEVGKRLREELRRFKGASLDDPSTIRNVRKAVIRYLAVRFPGESPEVLADLVSEHVQAGAGLVARTSEIVAALWSRGRR